jgi:hypothetical protein
VEFSVYASIEKHFLAKVPDDGEEPIITDVTKVIRTLNSLCKEMDTRYDLLKMAQARNIKEYNKKFIDRQLNPEHGHHYRRHQGGAHAELTLQGDGYALRLTENGSGAQPQGI